ncbi:hypothetical protein K2X89_08640, partial [Myxococcota bacterium]|nr:hypothetical protein [Myxococcota bacterium]
MDAALITTQEWIPLGLGFELGRGSMGRRSSAFDPRIPSSRATLCNARAEAERQRRSASDAANRSCPAEITGGFAGLWISVLSAVAMDRFEALRLEAWKEVARNS